jgi:hypothetical protein
LRTSIIIDSLLFTHFSQLFLALSLIGFSLTGRNLYKLTSDGMQGELFSTLFGGEEEKEQTPEEEEKKEERKEKREVQDAINQQFMGILFELFEKSTKVISEIAKQAVEADFKDINLQEKFTVDDLCQAHGKIHLAVIAELFDGGIEVPNDTESSSSDDEEEKEELDTYRPMIVKELVKQAEEIDIESYEKTLEDTIRVRGLNSSYAEHADVESLLETMVREALDLIETPYFSSLLADLVQF